MFVYYNPHPGGRGPYPRSHFAHTDCRLCTYSARTLRMFRHVLLMFRQIHEICRREVRENFARPRSSSSTLVYRHRYLFSCGFFARDNILSTFCQQSEHFLVNHTLPLTYFLSIASYCFIFNICLKWKIPVGTYSLFTNRCPLDALIGRKLFFVLLEASIAKGRLFRICGK